MTKPTAPDTSTTRREQLRLAARAVGTAAIHGTVVVPLVGGYIAVWALLGWSLGSAFLAAYSSPDAATAIARPTLTVGKVIGTGSFVLIASYHVQSRVGDWLSEGRMELLTGVHPVATDEDTTQNNDKFPPYRPLDEPELQRQFVGPVRRLAATADVAVPSLGVHPSSTPLCYTVHDQGETVLIASRGLFETLPDRELEAVLAHEVAHLSNGDHRLLSLVTAPLVLVEQLSGPPVDGTKPDSDYDHWSDVLYMVLVAVGSACTVVLFMALLSRFGGYVALLVTALAFIVAVTAFTYAYRAALGWATLGTGLFSRGRELAADRGAAALTGDPGALAAALQRLHEADYERPSTDLRDLAHTHDALNVVPTLDPGRDVGGILGTHPPTDERIERLRELEAAFETA